VLTFKRRFSKSGEDIYDGVTWNRTSLEITNVNGEKIFSLDDAEFPEFYSRNSKSIIASKYFIKGVETSLKQLLDRITDTIGEWAIQQEYFNENTLESLQIFKDELKYMMLHQMFAFNSPVYFNLGNPLTEPQISACFIVGIEDTLEDIAEKVALEMQIFKGGSGAGSNRSALRSSRESISRGGKSSGPCPFMKIYDIASAVTKSGGITRRAAKMEILNMDHGDIQEFIWQKKLEEDKAKALIHAGWNPEFDDPKGAYGNVFFQNSNQSVSVTDNFMLSVESKEPWALIERYSVLHTDLTFAKATHQGKFYSDNSGQDFLLDIDDLYFKVIEWVSAEDLFKNLGSCAWETGDPGVQFHDNINTYHTCKEDGGIIASNPCSEYFFLNDTSCNLASLNLIKFLDPVKNNFDFDKFEHACRIAITAQDILISPAHYPSEKIGNNTRKYRTLGLNYSNAGALLMRKGFAYGSDEGRYYLSSITALMHSIAYHQSSVIANFLGSFDGYANNKSSMLEVLTKHVLNIKRFLGDEKQLPFETANIFARAQIRLNSVISSSSPKFRNAQVTVLAPTGTISFMMDCETTGCEPAINLITYKQLVGGGELRLGIPSVSIGLKTLNYTQEEILEIEAYVEKRNTVFGAPHLKREHYPVFATSNGSENVLTPMDHINMLSVLQPFISGGISKTVNLPNGATKKDILNIYSASWRLGLKSVAVYRDGCKLSQPLNTRSEKKISDTPPVQTPVNQSVNGRVAPARRRLPPTRKGKIHKFHIGGHKGYVIVGEYDDGSLGEIFLNMGKEGGTVSGFADQWGVVISIALQYGIPLSVFINAGKGTRFDPSGITDNENIHFSTSVIDYVLKFLETDYNRKNLAKEDEVKILQKNNKEELLSDTTNNSTTDIICSSCGNFMVKTGSCYGCSNCGNSSGCA